MPEHVMLPAAKRFFDFLAKTMEVEYMESKKLNNITKPAWYYNDGKAQVGPLDYAEQQGLGILEHAIIKYVTRAGRKPGNSRLKDLKQAKFYLLRAIEQEEADEKEAIAGRPDSAGTPVCLRCGGRLDVAQGSFQNICDDCIKTINTTKEVVDNFAGDAVLHSDGDGRIGPSDRRKCYKKVCMEMRRKQSQGRRSTDNIEYVDLPFCKKG